MQTTQMEYDVIMPVGPNDGAIAAVSIQYVIKHLSFGRLIVLANKKICDQLQQQVFSQTIIFIDEETIIPQVGIKTIQAYCRNLYGDASRGGWYFQQFLKMAIARYTQTAIAENYLIWDADTIPLKQILFFNEEGRTLFSYKSEDHIPYFDTLKKILGIDKQVNFSFITEHMMMNKKIMNELIDAIEAAQIEGDSWIEKILLAVNKDQYQSGFSEFETYGNYIAKYYPDRMSFRKIKHKRSGSKITSKPNALVLTVLSLFRDTVSFENGHVY